MTMRGQNEDRSGRYQQGKVLAMNYDAYNALPGDTCLYCLTDKQQMILIALLEQVGWPTRWYSPSGATIDRDAIEGYRGDLAAALMSDVCAEIMTKLDDIIHKVDNLDGELDTLQTDLTLSQAAQDVAIAGILSELTGIIEPSIALLAAAIAGIAAQTTTILSDVAEIGTDVDHIEDIVADADDGVAEISEDVDNIEILVGKMKNSVTNITNNTLITLNFAGPDETFSSSSTDTTLTETYARYNALCEAVVNWMVADAYAVIDILGAGPTDLNTLAASIQAYALSLAYVLIPGVPAYTISTIVAAFTDTAALNDVACAIITYLQNLPPTSLNFSAALSAYTPPALPDNRHIIYDTLLLALFDLQAYQGFLSILQPAFEKQIASAPTGYVCVPCGTFPGFCGIPETWDFAAGVKAPWLISRGKLVYGQGIVGTQAPGDLNFSVEVNMYFPTPCTTIVGHHFEVTHAHLSNVGNSFVVQYYYLLSGVETLFNSSSRAQVLAWPQDDVDSMVVPNPPGSVGISRIRFACLTTFAPVTGLSTSASSASRISKIRFIT
jgi:hypothetical protein